MATIVTRSRTVRVSPEAAYDGTIDASLQQLFAHRHLALLPVESVYGQDGRWGRSVGQTRVVRSADGGALLETLTAIDRPRGFSYTLEGVRGRMRPFIKRVDGAWAFTPTGTTAGTPTGTATEITWSWVIVPTSFLAAPVAALVGRMWQGYARHALATLESMLTA